MDAFYASVEQLDHPEYRGKPIAVGGSRERGVVAAASYEARKFGVKSAMASSMAYRKCPQIIFVKPRFERYKEISQQIREIFFRYTDLVEPLSLDEAFLDVTENKQGMQSASAIAEQIRKEILDETGLTASAGVSKNKFLAKVASDYRKPNGMFIIHPDKAEAFVAQLEIERFFGIGKVTAAKMHRLGISTGKDLRNRSLPFLLNQFGKAGQHYYWISRSIDNRSVKPNRIRKSVGAENTFFNDLTSIEKMKEELLRICEKVSSRMQVAKATGTTITLKVKFHDFEVITRSHTVAHPLKEALAIYHVIEELLEENYQPNWNVRLLGVSMKNLIFQEKHTKGKQLTLNF